jgi:photosystem II stability/assembly factor-like uncharacterized protein
MPDDDLEARLRQTFAARAEQAPPAGPVEQRTLAAVRRGENRSRRSRWLSVTSLRPVAVAASVLAVVGATAGGVALVRNLNDGDHTGTHHVTASSRSATPTSPAPTANSSAPTGSAPPPVTGSGSGSASAPPTDTTAVEPKTGPAPKGLAVADLTFVSANAGWALGTVATCAQKPCTSLIRTTDGGKNWVGLEPPVVELAGASGCATSNCVSGVRFANARIGYLYGPRTLYRTTDAGATWARLAGGADALEIAAGNVLRVTTTKPDCRPSCTYLVESADVGGTAWHSVLKITAGSGDGAALVRAGRTAFVQVYAHVAGGAQSAHTSLYTSTDGGQSWASRGDPCPQIYGTSVEYDASSLAPTPSTSVAVLCRPRAPGHNPFVATSSNAGVTFAAGTAKAGLSAPIAAESARDVFATVAGSPKSAGQLLRSTDGGKTWAVVATAPATSTFGGFAYGFLGFENTTTGRWVSPSDPYTIWTTRDAGATWTRHSLK